MATTIIRNELLKPWAEYAAASEAEAEARRKETGGEGEGGVVAGISRYIAGAGPSMTIADFAFWPVLHDLVGAFGMGILDGGGDGDGEGGGGGALLRYYERVKGRDATRRVLAAAGGGGDGGAAAS